MREGGRSEGGGEGGREGRGGEGVSVYGNRRQWKMTQAHKRQVHCIHITSNQHFYMSTFYINYVTVTKDYQY